MKLSEVSDRLFELAKQFSRSQAGGGYAAITVVAALDAPVDAPMEAVLLNRPTLTRFIADKYATKASSLDIATAYIRRYGIEKGTVLVRVFVMFCAPKVDEERQYRRLVHYSNFPVSLLEMQDPIIVPNLKAVKGGRA